MPRGDATALRDLIIDANGPGESFRSLAARAIDPITGTKVSLNYLGKLARGEVDRMPSEGHLGALAAAFKLDYEIVRRAALLQYKPPRSEELLDVEEQSLIHMRVYGVPAVTAAVKVTYRRLDEEFKAAHPELATEQLERAERAIGQASEAIGEADQEVPRSRPRHRSA